MIGSIPGAVAALALGTASAQEAAVPPAVEDAAPAGAAAADAAPDSLNLWNVERADRDEPKLPTLRFLEDNRDFFRGRLDALLLVADFRALGARALDARYLRWREMLAEIRAARDSASAGEERIARAELLASVAGIEALEREMDAMESLLGDQHDRLGLLEADFVGRQRTALVLVMSGMPGPGAPRTVVVEEANGPTYRVDLTDAARESLARGAATEVFHELVEPRAHRLLVTLEGDGWASAAPVEVALEPARDRLTFLELDVAGYDPAPGGAPPPVTSWTR
jgi:hypothetical protein